MSRSHLKSVGLLLLLGLLFLTGCRTKPKKKLLILGIDGCDPRLLTQFMDQGKLPNFQRLEEMGGFRELATVNPPQSPVAWATFTTGLDPGGHGIFDFIHRDPQTLQVVPSLTKVEDGRAVLLRDGPPFWQYLEDKGIPATLIKVPANYPPDRLPGKVLSGMGTPDLLGSYGTYTYYTTSSDPRPPDLSGGRFIRLRGDSGEISAILEGPQGEPVPLMIVAEEGACLILYQDQEVLLKTGEWSNWVPVGFQAGLGMVRFYLKSSKPLRLYVSPINMDPCDPALPVSSPRSFAGHLCQSCGPFYTQGMPEETKALTEEILEDGEFLAQNRLVIEERRRLFEQSLKDFDDGLLFFYFSTPDILSHLFWNTVDPNHPGYTKERAEKFGAVIESAYTEADHLVGEALEKMDSRTTLLVLSDHGFAPFYRSFGLNAWLAREGYLSQSGESLQEVNWSRTKAYGVGFNGLYLNLQGRENLGRVSADEKEGLLSELVEKLEAVRDPRTGEKVIRKVYRSPQIYSGSHLIEAPDLVVGYEPGYRASWESVLGSAQGEILEDNKNAWSGDHLITPDAVPGVLLSTAPLSQGPCDLVDLAPTVLKFFSLTPPSSMTGKSVLKTKGEGSVD